MYWLKSAAKFFAYAIAGVVLLFIVLSSAFDGSLSERMSRPVTLLDVIVIVWIASHIVCAVVVNRIDSLSKRIFPDDYS